MNIQRLEQRRLFAVTVTETYPGYFEIVGDETANVIDVSVSMTYGTFSLAGNTYGNVGNIQVFGHGGDDAISVLSTDGFGYIGASILAGDGSDSISLNFDGAIWAGAGNDRLDLRDSFRGEAYGEGGDDRMLVGGDCIDAEIQGGDGNDVIDARGNNFAVLIRGGRGDDTIYGSSFDDRLYGDDGSDAVYGMAGNDTFFSSEYVDGGDGNDILFRQNVATVYTGIEQVFLG